MKTIVNLLFTWCYNVAIATSDIHVIRMLNLLLVAVNDIRWKIKYKCLRCKDEIASSTDCHQLVVDPAFRYIDVNMKSLHSLEFNTNWMNPLRVGYFVSVCTYYSSLYLWALANLGADKIMCACFICMWNSALYWCRHHAVVLYGCWTIAKQMYTSHCFFSFPLPHIHS